MESNLDLVFVNFLLIVAGYVNVAVAVVVLVHFYRKFKPSQMGQFEQAARSQIPVLVADMTTGEILFATPAAETLFGYFPGELAGLNVDVLVPAAATDRHAGLRATFAADPVTRAMAGIGGRRKDGREIQVEVGLNVAVIDGRRCVVAVVFDKTKRKGADQWIGTKRAR